MTGRRPTMVHHIAITLYMLSWVSLSRYDLWMVKSCHILITIPWGYMSVRKLLASCCPLGVIISAGRRSFLYDHHLHVRVSNKLLIFWESVRMLEFATTMLCRLGLECQNGVVFVFHCICGWKYLWRRLHTVSQVLNLIEILLAPLAHLVWLFNIGNALNEFLET